MPLIVTASPTSKIVHLNGIPARIWEGTTEGGLKVHLFITRVSCGMDADSSELVQALRETAVPSAEVQAYPARLVL